MPLPRFAGQTNPKVCVFMCFRQQAATTIIYGVCDTVTKTCKYTVYLFSWWSVSDKIMLFLHVFEPVQNRRVQSHLKQYSQVITPYWKAVF